MSVECYAGGRADERPLAVALDGKRLRVEEAKPAGVYEDAARRRWRSFIVRLEDGRRGLPGECVDLARSPVASFPVKADGDK